MNKNPLILYDIAGTTIMLCLAAVATWCGAIHSPSVSGKLAEMETNLEKMESSLRNTENAIRRKTVELGDLQADIESRGALPSKSPVETNLRNITRLARDNEVELISVKPSEEKAYPGLTEIKYAIEAKSGFRDLVQFLKDFEESEFWADVTKLKVETGSRNRVANDNTQSSELVLSLFASQNQADTQ